MKFSSIEDILLHKYRGGKSPEKIQRGYILDRVFYACSALMLICAIVLNLLYASGKFQKAEDDGLLTPWQTPEVTEQDSFGLKDMSGNVKEVSINRARINEPSIYGHEMLFSAGSGSLEKSVLTELYLFDADTAESRKIAEAAVGEIYETHLSKNWLVWLDTDHKGRNVIYKMNRSEIEGEKKASVVQETENHMPKLALWGDYLVWMEQVSDSEDKLYFVDLNTDENMALGMFDNTAYAVSAPYIYENTVIWAEKDPSDDSKSAIYSVTFEDLGKVNQSDEYNPDDETDSGLAEPKVFSTGTYVHKPKCNGDIYVWIDKNNAPDSVLYYAYKNETPVKFWNNVTQYALGDDFITFVSNQTVYAYYYKTDVLAQVSQSGRSAILPQCTGNLVVWEDKTDSGDDVFKYNILGQDNE